MTRFVYPGSSNPGQEREGDLAIDATVADNFAKKLGTQEKNTQVVVIDVENNGEFVLSSLFVCLFVCISKALTTKRMLTLRLSCTRVSIP